MSERRETIPTVRQMRAFLAVVQHGSMSKAAEDVFVSQSAVSQAILKMERMYAARLVERRQNGVAITPIGRVVKRRFVRALTSLQAIEARLLKPHANPKFVNSVTVPQLRALVAYRDVGTFAGASRATGQAKSTLQRAARGVEKVLNVDLFAVDDGRLQLTRKGEAVATLVSYALTEMENAYFEVRERQGDFSGTIRIGALPWVRGNVVPRAIIEITKNYPRARLNLVEGSYDDLVARLLSGQIELMVGALRGGGAPAGVTELELFKDRLCIIARREHPIFDREIKWSEVLVRYPWVLPVKGTPVREIYDSMLFSANVTPVSNGLVETGSSALIGEIVRMSDSLTIVSPLQLGFSGQVSSDFRVVETEVPNAVRSIGVSYRTAALFTGLQQGFVDELSRVTAMSVNLGADVAQEIRKVV